MFVINFPLNNLIDDLSWIQRVNIILQFARLLQFFHAQDKPYLVLNICGSHVMLDWVRPITLFH